MGHHMFPMKPFGNVGVEHLYKPDALPVSQPTVLQQQWRSKLS